MPGEEETLYQKHISPPRLCHCSYTATDKEMCTCAARRYARMFVFTCGRTHVRRCRCIECMCSNRLMDCVNHSQEEGRQGHETVGADVEKESSGTTSSYKYNILHFISTHKLINKSYLLHFFDLLLLLHLREYQKSL